MHSNTTVLPPSQPQRHGRGWRVLALALAAALPGACSTTDPIENYVPPARTDVGTSGVGGSQPVGGNVAATSSAPGMAGMAGMAGMEAESSSGGAGGTDSGATSSGGGGGDPQFVVDCSPPATTTPAFSKKALRAAAADCASYHFCVFEAHAEFLERLVKQWARSPSAEQQQLARAAWREAMARWQYLELFQFGPLANPAMSAGKDTFQGLGIRDKIYAWPTTARCRVDEQVVGRGYTRQGMDGVLISGRGLYALEVLLFHEAETSGCVASSSTAEAYAALEPSTLRSHKLEYAVAVAADVVQQMHNLEAAWSPESGNFREHFVTASGYPDEQQAMNVLGWALSYVEREVKDYKLGLPAGYTLSAPVSEAEAVYAGTGSENLRSNLLGFRSLYQGCGSAGEGLGFDDWLIAAGHAELARDIELAWEHAYATVSQLPALHGADSSSLEPSYLAVKALTDLVKNELLGAGSPLNLDLPMALEGDTD